MPLTSAAARYPGGTGAAIATPASYAGTFIPTIWSAKLLEKFYDATVVAAVSNTDYEGEIRNQGDTIKIRQRPDITVFDYSPDGELPVQRPNAPTVDLTIDYAKAWNTILDDVWEVQSDLDQLSMWATDASESLKVTIDTQVLRTIFLGSAAAANKGAAAGRISANIGLGITTAPKLIVPRNPTALQSDPIDLIVDMGQVLDEQNIPENDRWLIVPAWFASMIKKSDLRDASLSGDGTSMLRNGRLGVVDRFTIYMSNLLPAGVTGGLVAGEFAIFAGHKIAPTFASQINKTETLRSERTFGRLMRGLCVYGAKVIKNTAIVEAIIKKGP